MRLRAAFTLIELLVVIAIIAILAAILFPVFAQAKLAAKKTAALSNVKQNALAVIMYIGDYDSTYPQVVYMQNGNGIVGPGGTGNQVYAVFDAIIPYTKNKDIFLSPGDPKAIHWSDDPQTTGSILGSLSGGMWVSVEKINYSSFAPNFRLFEDTAVAAPFGLGRPVRNESGIPDPVYTTMFYDAKYNPAGTVNEEVPLGSPYHTPALPFSRFNFPGTARYNETLVVNFADSHAKTFRYNSVFGGQALEGGVMTQVYNLPYDLNGIPGVVAESLP